ASPRLTIVLDIGNEGVVAGCVRPPGVDVGRLAATRRCSAADGHTAQGVALPPVDAAVGSMADHEETALGVGLALIVLNGEPEIRFLSCPRPRDRAATGRKAKAR